jgi:predicted RNase H-related nuclease YkuK (DUF458 family)
MICPFRNTTESALSLNDVYDRVYSFMTRDPRAEYNFMIGTDCQVHPKHTKVITGVIIQRVGKGAWACYRSVVVPREYTSIKEKLSMETSYSEEIAAYFTPEKRFVLEDIILPYVYKGSSLTFYIDIDAGSDERVSRTAPFVAEMVRRVEAIGMKARIKPNSLASYYADKYSKQPHPGFMVGDNRSKLRTDSISY